jgi:hypothetical protein
MQDHEQELLALIDQYQQATINYENAKKILDAVKEALKSYGTSRVGDYWVDVTSVERESISWSDIKKHNPHLAAQLIDLGLVKKSTSERLSVKLKETP